MDVEIHAPTKLVLLTSLAIAVVGLVCFFLVSPNNMHIAFWIAILAYVVAALGAIVKI
jgi:hypothetical protein